MYCKINLFFKPKKRRVKMNNVKMYRNIFNHGENLKKVFNLPADTEPVKLCKKLFSLETKAHRLAERWCNGEITGEQWEAETDKILNKVDQLLGYSDKNISVFANGDARGYCLKIKVKDTPSYFFKDWGGFGIIAPDFRVSVIVEE